MVAPAGQPDGGRALPGRWLAASLGNTEVRALVTVGLVLAAAPIAAAGYAVTIVLQAPRYVFADLPPPYDVLQLDPRPGLVEASEVVRTPAARWPSPSGRASWPRACGAPTAASAARWA